MPNPAFPDLKQDQAAWSRLSKLNKLPVFVLYHNNKPFQTADVSDLTKVARFVPDLYDCSDADACEFVYVATQHGIPDEYYQQALNKFISRSFEVEKYRSTSVGDVIALEYNDGTVCRYVVDGVGFKFLC